MFFLKYIIYITFAVDWLIDAELYFINISVNSQLLSWFSSVVSSVHWSVRRKVKVFISNLLLCWLKYYVIFINNYFSEIIFEVK